MKYNPIEEEKKWRSDGEAKNGNTKKPLPPKHHFAHGCVRSRLYDTLVTLGCDNSSSVLDVGCGSGEDATYVQKASKNIVGVDMVQKALKRFTFTTNRFQGILADVKKLPFRNSSFDYLISSGLLHHLVGQGDLKEYLREFARVTRGGGVCDSIGAKFI